MEEQDFIAELMTSSKHQNSPVAFLPGLLKSFFSSEIDEATFKKEFDDKSCQAKIFWESSDSFLLQKRLSSGAIYALIRVKDSFDGK